MWPSGVASLCVGMLVWGLSSFALDASEQDDRGRARELIERADAAAASGRVTEAVTLLEQAEKAAPSWPELKVNLAAARSRAGDYTGAAAAARAALALNPSLDGARFNLGLALLKSGDAAGAAVTLAPYANARVPAEIHAALGLAWMRLNRSEEAAPALQRSIDAGIRDRETLLAAARAWLQTGKPALARGPMTLLEKQAPAWIQTRLLAGDVADARQDWAAAALQYRAAIELQPESAQAHYSLGLILYKQREYEAAAEELRTALRLAPTHVPAHYYLALLELDRGNAKEGAALLERAATLEPTRGDVARDLGRALMDLDLYGEAADSLRRAVKLVPEDSSAWYLLGRALKGIGDQEEARAAFARAAELNQLLRERLNRQVSGIKR